MKLHIATLTILAALFFMPVSAQAGGHTVDKFMQADTDQNGLVSKEEYMNRYDSKFMKMDADSDGSVSGEEYEAYIAAKYKEKQQEKFKMMDTDGDGMISMEEMSASAKSSKHKH